MKKKCYIIAFLMFIAPDIIWTLTTTNIVFSFFREPTYSLIYFPCKVISLQLALIIIWSYHFLKKGNDEDKK